MNIRKSLKMSRENFTEIFRNYQRNIFTKRSLKIYNGPFNFQVCFQLGRVGQNVYKRKQKLEMVRVSGTTENSSIYRGTERKATRRERKINVEKTSRLFKKFVTTKARQVITKKTKQRERKRRGGQEKTFGSKVRGLEELQEKDGSQGHQGRISTRGE